MNNGEKALELFNKGYCCSQSVLGAFADEPWFIESGLTLETAMKLSSSFGGGIGRSREVCGAVSGMCMAAGIAAGFNSPNADNAALLKKGHYDLIQELLAEFKLKNGSIICKELLGIVPNGTTPEKRTDEYYKKRPCGELCKMAAIILEQQLKNK